MAQLSAELFPIRESFELLVVRQQARYRAKFSLKVGVARQTQAAIGVLLE
jgi:hypothetical protein